MHWYSKKVRTTRLCLKSPAHEYINRHRTFLFFKRLAILSRACILSPSYLITLHTQIWWRFYVTTIASLPTLSPYFFFYYTTTGKHCRILFEPTADDWVCFFYVAQLYLMRRARKKMIQTIKQDVDTVEMTIYTLLRPGATWEWTRDGERTEESGGTPWIIWQNRRAGLHVNTLL